jgi:hypothetical protein
MKTSELTGAALDWAVAKCEGYTGIALQERTNTDWYSPSTNWAQGGPIIEREKIELICNGIQPEGLQWVAQTQKEKWTNDPLEGGQTPLIAAMRCYVASKLGNEVDIPSELTQGETK